MQRLLGSSSALLLSALLAISSGATVAAEATSAAPAPAAIAAPAKPKPDLKAQADTGDPAAALKFALPLLAPNRSPADLAEGLKYLQLAADAKLPEADLRLGDAYRTGSFGLAADANRAIAYYQQAADAGNVSALNRLGDLYRAGATGLPKDPAKAFGLYKKAADLADNGAKKKLGDMMVKGEGTAVDFDGGVALVKGVADGGDIGALVQLGDYYAKPDFGKLDPQAAIAYYQKAADTGNVGGFTRLGDLYRNGVTGLPKDPAKAASFYEQALAKGDNTARKALAAMLLDGKSLPTDATHALGLLNDAITAGDPGASIALANVYKNGQGVPVDGNQALTLLQPLVVKNNLGAINALGDLYRFGAGTISKDPTKAYGLYRQAADLGDNGAKKKLGDMTVKGEGVTADFAAGVTLVKSVADAGDVGALIQLGDYYAKPDFGGLDAKLAIAYYQQAADAGNVGGLDKLGDLYRNGTVGVPKDPKQAAAFYTHAIAKSDSTARKNLAAMLLDGKSLPLDSKAALGLLNDAIAAGDAGAAQNLGLAYANGQGLKPSYALAKAAIDKATALGSTTGQLRFGVALLNGPLARRHAGDGAALLQAAADANVPGGKLELARAEIGGKVSGATAAGAVKLLGTAIDGGDVGALKYLIGLYRDGSGKLIAKAPDKAMQLITDGTTLLGAEAAAIERIYVNASLPLTNDSFGLIATDFDTLSRPGALQVLQRLRGANRGAYVALAQRGLLRLGLYAGKVDGALTKATTAAITAACLKLETQSTCSTGTLIDASAGAVGLAITQPGAATIAVATDIPAGLGSPLPAKPAGKKSAPRTPAKPPTQVATGPSISQFLAGAGIPNSGTCAATGPITLEGVPTDFKKFLPSQRKYLSGVGMSALRTGCLPRLVCVAASSSDADKKTAGQMCGAAKNALTRSAPNGAVSASIQTQIVVASAQAGAGVVYLSLVPGTPDWTKVKLRAPSPSRSLGSH